ncbi:MAG: polysaccharide deacetylase family protein [Halothiobacillus sp.]|jgi:peptidoglycan/xylan/chitin deacetylase (PgdA/CDA1 family)|nr:polysaccharide deacetylase family protein [Halothiobacillus sp.]
MTIWLTGLVLVVIVLATLALAARYNLWRPSKPLSLPRILMYHSIRPVVPPTGRGSGIVTTPEQFAWQMDWLARHGARFVTVSQLMAADDHTHMVANTFDDGYVDNYTIAWPILQKYNAPATIYLAPEMPGINPLTPEMVREMSASGIEFGAHTLTHIHLPSTDDATAEREIRQSRGAVQVLTGQPCSSFAYPYGKLADRHVEMVRLAGFSSAVTTKKRVMPWAEVHSLRLPRLSMLGQMNRFEFWLTITRGRYRV